MGSITERSGKFRAKIRRKNKEMNAVFHDRTTAEIWVKYHEELIDNFEAFQVPVENMITLSECLELKIKEVIEKKVHQRSLQDFYNCSEEFQEIMNFSIAEITSDMIRKISNKKLNSLVRRGGNKNNNTGNINIVSPSTILRKLRILSSVFSYMIKNGANITNVAQIIVNHVSMSIVKKGESLQDEQ